jgi:hypothetical protein
MHTQQRENPELASEHAAGAAHSDAATSVDQQDLRWWEEWGSVDNEWGKLDYDEQRRARKKT